MDLISVANLPSSAPSSVHTSETTGKNASTGSLAAKFARSFACRQSKAIELYEHLDYSPENSRAARLRKCRKVAWFSRHKVTGEVRLCFDCCKLRWCVHCGSARISWMTFAASSWLHTLDRPKFVTLTLRHSNSNLTWQIMNLYRFFRALRKRPDWKLYVQGGIWFFQIKKSDPSGQWHTHIHCLLDAYYYPQYELREAWRKVTGGSFIVDIRPIHNPKKASNDAARYAACPADLSELDIDEALDVYHALHGRQLCGTFGTAKGVPLKPPKDEHPELWEIIGGRSLVNGLRDTDDNAKAILYAYHTNTPLAEGVNISCVENFLDNFNSRYPVFGDYDYGTNQSHPKKPAQPETPKLFSSSSLPRRTSPHLH